MEDLKKYFPNTTLDTKEIRKSIIDITGLTEDKNYFCYSCFKYLGSGVPNNMKCLVCYRFYCQTCSPKYWSGGRNKYIDTEKCIQCIENKTPF